MVSQGAAHLPETLAGAAAAAYAVEQSPVTQDLSSLAEDESDRVRSRYLRGDGKTEKVAELRHDLQMTMEDGAGVFRTGDALQQALDKLGELRQRSQRMAIQDTTRTFNVELIGALELDFMLDVAETILHSAHARHESRGAHVRRDYPERDDQNFLTHTLAYRTPDGPRLDSLPVTITQWQPEERKY